jgi:ureidoglycolate lyase
MSMFACFPRDGALVDGQFEVAILERHPFTTQTFAPLGRAPTSSTEACYLVIVAPSLPPRAGDAVSRGPDLHRLRAFRDHGGQAVTYGVGTWHAPMVVLGGRRVDFIVTQFVNGVAKEDCEEVRVGGGVWVGVNNGRSYGNRSKL